MTSAPPNRHTSERLVSESASLPSVSNRDALVEFLVDRLEPPLLVEEEALDLQEALTTFWWELIRSHHQCDQEVPYGADDLMLGGVASAVEAHYDGAGNAALYEDATRVDSWYARARQQFLRETRLVRGLVVGPAARPKHYPSPGARSMDDLRDQSRLPKGRPESVLLFGVTAGVIGMLARAVEAQSLQYLVSVSNRTLYVNCMCDIGLVNGSPTSHLAIEWTSGGAIHGYPVTAAEADSGGFPVVYDDSAQGYGRETPRE